MRRRSSSVQYLGTSSELWKVKVGPLCSFCEFPGMFVFLKTHKSFTYFTKTDFSAACVLSVRRPQQPGHRGRRHERSALSGQRPAERQNRQLGLQQTGETHRIFFVVVHIWNFDGAKQPLDCRAAAAARKTWWSSPTTTSTSWCWTVTRCGWWSFSPPGADTARSESIHHAVNQFRDGSKGQGSELSRVRRRGAGAPAGGWS